LGPYGSCSTKSTNAGPQVRIERGTLPVQSRRWSRTAAGMLGCPAPDRDRPSRHHPGRFRDPGGHRRRRVPGTDLHPRAPPRGPRRVPRCRGARGGAQGGAARAGHGSPGCSRPRRSCRHHRPRHAVSRAPWGAGATTRYGGPEWTGLSRGRAAPTGRVTRRTTSWPAGSMRSECPGTVVGFDEDVVVRAVSGETFRWWHYHPLRLRATVASRGLGDADPRAARPAGRRGLVLLQHRALIVSPRRRGAAVTPRPVILTSPAVVAVCAWRVWWWVPACANDRERDRLGAHPQGSSSDLRF